MAGRAWGGLSALHLVFCGVSWAVGPGWYGVRLWRWRSNYAYHQLAVAIIVTGHLSFPQAKLRL